MDSSAHPASYPVQIAKTEENARCVDQDYYQNVTVHLGIPEKNVNKSVRMGYGESIAPINVPVNFVIQLPDLVDVKIQRSARMVRVLMVSLSL